MPETSSPGISDDPGSPDNEQAARSLLDAFARFDLDTYESLIAEDAVERRPQTGDRFVGRAKIIGMYRHYPADPPVVTWERSVAPAPSSLPRARSTTTAVAP